MSQKSEKVSHSSLSIDNTIGVLSLSQSLGSDSDSVQQVVKSNATVKCVCTPAVHHSTCTICCAGCNKSTQIACLLQQFRIADGSSNKYNHEWLKKLLVFHNMTFVCNACRTSSIVDITTNIALPATNSGALPSTNSDVLQRCIDLTTEVKNLSSKVVEMGQQMSSIQSTLTAFTVDNFVSSSMDSNSSNGNSIPMPAMQLTGSKSYAQVLSQDLSKAVEAAVSETLTSQRHSERASLSVVIYGLPEENNDRSKVLNMFSSISCHAKPIKMFRLGRDGHSGKSPRPLKVDMRTLHDRNELLSSASQLIKSVLTKHIRISAWLSREDMAKVRSLRERCKMLNDSAPVNDKGIKPYFVISGRLMTRDNNGHLKPVNMKNADDAVKVYSSGVIHAQQLTTSNTASAQIGSGPLPHSADYTVTQKFSSTLGQTKNE